MLGVSEASPESHGGRCAGRPLRGEGTARVSGCWIPLASPPQTHTFSLSSVYFVFSRLCSGLSWPLRWKLSLSTSTKKEVGGGRKAISTVL